MQRIIPYCLGLSLALWLGGLVMLFIILMSVFAHNKGLGAQVGPILFSKFEPYQIALAAISLVCALICPPRNSGKMRTVLVASLISAAILSAISHWMITPQIIDLWQNPTENSAARFQQLHAVSRYLYTANTIMVLIAGGAFIRMISVVPAKITTAGSINPTA